MVLRVGNQQVTQAEFESRIGEFETQENEGGEGEKEEKDDKDRRSLGDDYASVLMLSQRAVANHLDQTPEVARQLAVDRLQILSDAEFNRLLSEAKPTPEEISAYYNAHLSDFDEVKVRRLFIWKKRADGNGLSAADARARADAILQASKAGKDTQALADEFKDSHIGMIDPQPLTFPHGELRPKMEAVAFGLKDGEWGEIEDTPDSIILVQLVGRARQSLQYASSRVEKRLQGQKLQAKLDELKKKTGIWMDQEYFGARDEKKGTERNATAPSTQQKDSREKEEGKNEDERR